MRRSVLLALALLVAGAPAALAADWTAPFTVSGDRSIAGASVAADPRGGMVAVWQHDTKRPQPPRNGGFGGLESYVRARAIAPDGRPGSIQTLSVTGDLTAHPVVAADGRGGAVAAWTQAYEGRRYTILAAARAPGARFGSPEAIGRTDRFLGASPRVGMNARGDAVLLWARAGSVWLATRRAGGRFGAPQALATRRAVPGGVVVGAGGAAVAAWTSRGGVYVSERPPGRRFGAPRRLNLGGPGAAGATVAAGADGTVVVAWRTRGSAVAAVRDRGRAFGPAQTLAAFEASAALSGPAAAVTPSGEALVAWVQDAGDPIGVRGEAAVASRPPGGAFGPGRVLSAPGVSADQPALAAERRGEVVAAWSEAGPIGPGARWWASAAVRPAGSGDFRPAERVSGTSTSLAGVTVLGADDTASVLWRPGEQPLLAARRTG